MKQYIKNKIEEALTSLSIDGASMPIQDLQVDHTRDKKYGDFASNVALILAKTAHMNPRELAQQIINKLKVDPTIVTRIEIAGPGFINFYLSSTARHTIVNEILMQRDLFGRSKEGKGIKINFEFVSANPNGPLHVGHGRSVAYGAACASLLEAVGYEVHREYYVNDAGRQMDILATSVWLRYVELCNQTLPFPSNGYKGDYVITIAQLIHQKKNNQFCHSTSDIYENIPADLNENGEGDKEAHIDGLIARAKHLLGEENYKFIFDISLESILADIKNDLAEFGVIYDEWFSERSLYRSNAVGRYIERLKAKGHTFENEGNLWFRSTLFGDDKDRVLVRSNGQPTYFAADIAYHCEKFQRGANKIVFLVGADHHGYIARIKAALQALDIDPNLMETILVQFATLSRGKEKVQMSTRSGSFITLRELRNEVGKDAARFFYILRKADQHLNFDLELAKSQSTDNPVYYIQYAHARIASVFRQCKEKNLIWDQSEGIRHIHTLQESYELTIIDLLTRFGEVIQLAASGYEPHLLAHYLRQLAQEFHSYYNAIPFLTDDAPLRNARLCLIAAVRQLLANGLSLLGVYAPETM